MGSDPNFLVCRSFTNLRSRLLLVKQIELADLEYQLEYMEKELEEDALKKNELRHRRSYFDVERKEKLHEIEQRLEEYGSASSDDVMICFVYLGSPFWRGKASWARLP